jgi:hypothetical protein
LAATTHPLRKSAPLAYPAVQLFNEAEQVVVAGAGEAVAGE